MKSFKFVFLTLAIAISANAGAAVQFPNFLNAPRQSPDLSGIGDLVENMDKGYRIGNHAAMMRQQRRALELENNIMEEQLRALKRAHR